MAERVNLGEKMLQYCHLIKHLFITTETNPVGIIITLKWPNVDFSVAEHLHFFINFPKILLYF